MRNCVFVVWPVLVVSTVMMKAWVGLQVAAEAVGVVRNKTPSSIRQITNVNRMYVCFRCILIGRIR